MTNEEGELLNDIANEYWEELGQLVARHLMRAPQHLREELLTTLQERSSVYGCAYERHVEAGNLTAVRSVIKTKGFCVQPSEPGGKTMKTLIRYRK